MLHLFFSLLNNMIVSTPPLNIIVGLFHLESPREPHQVFTNPSSCSNSAYLAHSVSLLIHSHQKVISDVCITGFHRGIVLWTLYILCLSNWHLNCCLLLQHSSASSVYFVHFLLLNFSKESAQGMRSSKRMICLKASEVFTMFGNSSWFLRSIFIIFLLASQER